MLPAPSSFSMVPHIDPALSQLKKSGGRVTQQRIAVIKALRELAIPSTVEDVFYAARSIHPMDMVTAYRILGVFEKCGLVFHIFRSDGAQMFSLRTDEPRYFAVMRETHQVVEIDGETAAAIDGAARQIEDFLAKHGYKELSHVVQFFVHPTTRITDPRLCMGNRIQNNNSPC